MRLVLVQKCPTFYSSLAKYLFASLPRATIASVIKTMFSCKLVRKFYVTNTLRYRTLTRSLNFRLQNKCSSKKKVWTPIQILTYQFPSPKTSVL